MSLIQINHSLYLLSMYLLICFIPVSRAQQLPNHVEFSELGLSLDIPTGWVGQLSDDAVILGHHNLPGLMILTENLNHDVTTLKQQALQGLHDENIQLQAKGDFLIKSNNRVEGMYTGYFNGAEVSCFAIGLINGMGKGMNILIITEKNQFNDQHIHAANQLADSVKFYQAKDSNITTQWKKHLAGNQLKYMNTQGGSDYSGGYSGSSAVRQIDLCTNGQFSYYSNSHSSFSGGASGADGFGYANSNGQGEGTYQIHSIGNESVLILNFNTGESVEYNLTVSAEEHTLLDGNRYFVVDSEICQ